MTALAQLRRWAEEHPQRRKVQIRRDTNDKWLISVGVDEPFAFEQSTGWVVTATVETVTDHTSDLRGRLAPTPPGAAAASLRDAA